MMNLEGLEQYLKDSGLAERIEKLKPNESFGVEIPREVGYDEIPKVAEYIIDRIIKPYLASQGK